MDKFERTPLSSKRKIHLISIGNKIMSDLAIALIEKGYEVSGSDPGIKEPFVSRLETKGIRLYKDWNPDAIDNELMAVVPAPHIDNSNPELIASKEKRVLAISLSEFIFERTKNKIRVVIAGSKGRKYFLSLLLEVLKKQNVKLDYALNSEIEGIDKSIALSYDARIAVIEGDEFFTATIDKKPLLHFLRTPTYCRDYGYR